MDCIFKVWGYVPKRRFCTHCFLENILESFRYDEKKTSRAISLIMRTYALLKADDILRDEESRIKKALAKVAKRIYRMRLPEELNRIVEKADKTIRELEALDIDEEEYMKSISAIGGEVFQASLGDESAFSIGEKLSAAMTIHDMPKDRREDKRRNRFNPLKKASYEKLMTIASHTLLGIKPPVQGIKMYVPGVGLTSEGCSESINICIGVCLGVCYSLVLLGLSQSTSQLIHW